MNYIPFRISLVVRFKHSLFFIFKIYLMPVHHHITREHAMDLFFRAPSLISSPPNDEFGYRHYRLNSRPFIELT